MKTGKVFEKIKFIFLLFLLFQPLNTVFSQDKIDLDMLSAQEEFKWGVKAYHKGLFNESSRAFEKALSYKPENIEIQTWLGLSWFRSGFTDAALNIWGSVAASGKAGSLLMNRLEILKQQTGVSAFNVEPGRYLPAMELEGIQDDFTLFRRPSSVLPDSNGGFFIASYGSNQVLRFNSNGALADRLTGGLEGFNHPFDIKIGRNGLLFISEFNGDRITRCTQDGREILRFGKTGRGDGELIGPQYIAVDDRNFIYVTDSGNQRVVKFDSEGKFILSFGKKSYDFKGLSSPTGIECFDERVFVADADSASIHVFDGSGNYIKTFSDDQLYAPEGLSRIGLRSLLIADSERVLSLDVDTGIVRSISDLDGKGKKITKASVDVNGNLLTADFDLSRVTVLTELSNMYSGLFLQIDRISAANYPEVVVDVRMMDRAGLPFVGLSSNNFVVSENGYSVPDVKLVYTGNEDKQMDSVILLDCGLDMKEYHPDVLKAVKSLMNAAEGLSGLKLVSAGLNPATEADILEGSRQFMAAAADPGIFSGEAGFDLGLRHAASELIGVSGRKSVIFVTDGSLDGAAFDQYHPVELADYLKNNGINFYCVDVSNESGISEELEYICEETGGSLVYLYQPEGLGRIFEEMLEHPDGSYTLVFKSINRYLTQDDFIPLEVEAFLYNRSGRESSGYFKPGKF